MTVRHLIVDKEWLTVGQSGLVLNSKYFNNYVYARSYLSIMHG